MAKKSMAMTITEKVTKQSKAGARSASLPSVLPALQMPKLKTPAKTSGTQMPVLGKTTSKGVGIAQSVANGSGTQSSGRTTAPKVKTVKPAQQSATDRAANIRAFGAGDYSGGGELLEKAYKTARAAVKGIGSSYANIGGSAVEGMGNLQEIMQKGGNDKKIQQMKDNKAFYEQALKTGVNPRTGKKLTVDEKSRYYKILNTQYTDGKIAQMENIYKEATANQKARTMETANDAFAASDRLKASADKDVAAAKEGSGKVGQFLVDLGYTGTQLLADLAANAIAPGAGMVSMASRVYGDASAEARREGKTAGQQALSGLKGATIEVLTEKLFGGLAKAYGAGTADELVEKVADKLTKTEAGQRAAVWLINSGGEGLEEVVSDVLNPLADRALGLDDGTGAIFTTDDAAQMAYDFLLGGTMGLIGSSGQLRRGRTVQMPTLERTQDTSTAEMPQFATEPAAQDAQTAPGVNFNAETQNAAERLTRADTETGEITMPRVTDAAGNTYAQRQAAATFNDGSKSDAEGVLGLLRSNIPALEGIEPVANVTGQEVGETGRATDRVYNFFQSIGGKVRREGFGDVLFSKSRVRNSVVGHGSGEAKIQLAAAVPGVIENGVQINYTPNWKGRGYDSYVFAAPVTYDGKQTYVTAIVTKDDANRYYLHEALDAEGNVLYKKAEGYDAASDRPTATPQDTIADIEPSVDSIAQTEGAVNEVEMPVLAAEPAAQKIDLDAGRNVEEMAQAKIRKSRSGANYWDDQSYRGRRARDSALSDYGHAMFADDPSAIEAYGDTFYSVRHSDLADINDVKGRIAEQWEADKEAGMLPYELDVLSHLSGEEVAEAFDPADIVDSAGAWDDGDVMTWAFRAGVFDDIGGVKTSDGAVVWDEGLIHRTGISDDNIIGENVHNEVEMPVIGESAPSAFVRDGNIIRRDTSEATPADAMTWQDAYNYESRSDAPAEVTQEPVSAADRAEMDAYMDALAQDENILTDDPYTPADAVYDAQLRRLAESEAPPAAEQEQVLQADLDELASLYADQADVIGRREYLQDATSDMVTDKTTPKKQSKREAAREAWDFFYRKMVDAGHSVTKLSEAVSDPYLYQFYNQARASSSAGVNMITDAQTDVRGRKVGDSLNDVFSPIRARGEDLYHDFQLYMFDLHNIDRMSLSEGKAEKVLEAKAALRDFDTENPDIRTDTAAQLHRLTEDPDPDIAALARERERLLRNLDKAEAIQDKPVFDYEFSAEDSRARAEKLLAQHPEFAEYQAQVRKYIDNMMQYRVDSGLMTQENADFLKEFYPNYVPTMRVQDKDAAGRGRDLNAVRIGKTVGRAQGGTERLVPLHEALGKQTMKVVREGSKNRFADRLLRDYLRTGDTDAVNRYVKEASQYEHEFNPETLDDAAIERPSKDKIVTAYMDGKLWEMTVDDTLFDAVKALSPDTAESNKLTRVARGANNLFKSLVTGYNPTFFARNVIRDLQTAGLNTRDAAAFARNYPRALAEIKNNGEYWQLYKALGGVYSSVFDYTAGTVKEPKGRMGKVMARVEALNMAAEQAPRLAEFMGVMQEAEAAKQRGEAVSDLAAEADALYAAADITVNFGRSGSLGKVLNANYVPFLNPGVQGLDKLVRRVTETKGAKEWAKLAARAVALGIAPSLLNALLYHDDDEWDDLRDSDKDTNYMFKLGNGYWLKIPKGRELSLLGITADRVADAVRGEDVDILSTINTMGNQVAPANPLTSNIFSALIDSQLINPDSPGRTWYGGDIESQRLQNYAPGERYDSSTDVFSKAVGKALGISPKKLNYVLDQYSGVLGDFLLPVLTPQAERGMFEKAFTVDAMSSNRVSGDFYDEANELKYAKNAGDVASGVVSRWWNKQQTACSDLWKQIREVEASTELSDSEKKQQTRELKAIVTGIQKNAIAQEDVFRAAVESHLAAGEDEDTAYREANKDCFGAEYALQVYNKDVYERAQDAKQNGVSYDDFYTYYFGTKGIKATSTESAVSQKFDYLQRSGISEEAQAEIYFADMASDKTLLTQAELEMSAGITATQYYNYKAATSSMSKKAEKLEAIAAMDLTSEQKDALYYSEGWAESKIYEAPWRTGRSAGVSMPVLGGSGVTMPVLGNQGSSGVQMPVLGGGTVKMPVLK